ncbi:MAG: molybdopterin molybdotransferase MoeA [Polyangiaceae bacterium]|nr:molybdopterin molybdotransferase MoeA [Polyangiaceae bacterium]
MIRFEEALDRLLQGVRTLGSERVGLDEAPGRVLAEDVIAGFDLPSFDHSSMDGYAFHSGDFSGAGPWEFPLFGESAAGGHLPELKRGTACRIFTGARLPVGSDTIVAQEDVERTATGVHIKKAPTPNQWVRRRGADLAAGDIAIAHGTRLGPGHAALAAGVDRSTVFVARKPLVTVLCSGDELRAPGEKGVLGSIPESNGTFVAAAGRSAGAIVRVAPYVRDDLGAAEKAVRAALSGSDLLVTIGGVSVGDRDVMKAALEEAGVALDFWRVAIKPGKPICVGRSGSTIALGLPGNPASASLTFLLFGVPLLRAMQGDRDTLPARIKLPVEGHVKRPLGRMEFLRAQIVFSASGARAVILPNQASGAVTSFAQADALVVLPAERERVETGDVLEVIRIREM